MPKRIVTIGSLEIRDIVIADESILPSHAELEVRDDGLIYPVTEIKHIMHSGKRLGSNRALALGDDLLLGTICLRVDDILEPIRKKFPIAKLQDPAISMRLRLENPPEDSLRSRRIVALTCIIVLIGVCLAAFSRRG